MHPATTPEHPASAEPTTTQVSAREPATYVVIGAGITGLAAALELTEQVPGHQVVVLEAADRVGGKLRAGEVAGVTVDVGAESVLARRPEAVALIERIGLVDQVVHPHTTAAQIATRGGLHPLPARTLMGIPADPQTAAGVLTPQEVARASAEILPDQPPSAPDISVGDFVEQRLGAAVVDRLVEPLLGGVYAGDARLTSVAAALPMLLSAYRDATSLTAAIAAVMPEVTGTMSRPPVFAGLRGGLHQLAATAADTLAGRGVTLLTGTTAREIRRHGPGWQIITGPVPAPNVVEAEAVLITVPAAATARLLSPHSTLAGDILGAVESASMAVVTFAFRTAELPDLPGSGLLVPPAEGRYIKASTFSACKWQWVEQAGRGAGAAGEDLTLLRTSLGRHRQERDLQVEDAVLVQRSLDDLAQILAAPIPAPVDQHVQRWGGGLPQYFVGHTSRMAQVAAEVAQLSRVEVAGAVYQGVGIPACIASGQSAAQRLLAADPASRR